MLPIVFARSHLGALYRAAGGVVHLLHGMYPTAAAIYLSLSDGVVFGPKMNERLILTLGIMVTGYRSCPGPIQLDRGGSAKMTLV